eukprot:247390-Chlamydomonas_euryale.AAC.4
MLACLLACSPFLTGVASALSVSRWTHHIDDGAPVPGDHGGPTPQRRLPRRWPGNRWGRLPCLRFTPRAALDARRRAALGEQFAWLVAARVR